MVVSIAMGGAGSTSQQRLVEPPAIRHRGGEHVALKVKCVVPVSGCWLVAVICAYSTECAAPRGN